MTVNPVLLDCRPNTAGLRYVQVRQLSEAATAICVCALKTGTRLPSLPYCVKMFEPFIERGGIYRKFRKGNCCTECDVGKCWFVAAKHPWTPVGQMAIYQGRVRQRLFAAVFAPLVVLR